MSDKVCSLLDGSFARPPQCREGRCHVPIHAGPRRLTADQLTIEFRCEIASRTPPMHMRGSPVRLSSFDSCRLLSPGRLDSRHNEKESAEPCTNVLALHHFAKLFSLFCYVSSYTLLGLALELVALLARLAGAVRARLGAARALVDDAALAAEKAVAAEQARGDVGAAALGGAAGALGSALG